MNKIKQQISKTQNKLKTYTDEEDNKAYQYAGYIIATGLVILIAVLNY